MKLWRYLSVPVLGACLVGCDSNDDRNITVHDFYSQVMEMESFPQPINEKLKNILQNSDDFGLAEYVKFDLSIEKYCRGEEETWTDYVGLVPMILISEIFPHLNMFHMLSRPEPFVVRQLYAATTCIFEPVGTYR